MIITCPRCAARYGIDPVRFGLRARPVRCSACDWQWEAGGPEDDAADWRDGLALPPGEGSGAQASPGLPLWPGGADTPPGAVTGGAVVEASGWPVGEPPADESETGPAHRDDADAHPVGATLDDAGDGDSAGDLGAAGAPSQARLDGPAGVDAASGGAPAAADTWAVESRSGGADEESRETPPAPAAATVDGAGAPADRRRRLMLMAGGAGAALALLLVTLIAAEGPISRALPGARAVYHLFGLAPPPPGVGLDIRDVVSSREWTGSEDVLVVSGHVANVATAPRALPPLRVSLYDDDRTEVQTVVVEPAKQVLAAGESVRFVARIVAPVSAARRMVVSFDVSAMEHG